MHCVHIQKSSSDDACYVKLGVHLAFMSESRAIGVTSFKTLREVECIVRKRLLPPDGNGWQCGRSRRDAILVVERIVDTFLNNGEPWFMR